jgi:hypothetical protein
LKTLFLIGGFAQILGFVHLSPSVANTIKARVLHFECDFLQQSVVRATSLTQIMLFSWSPNFCRKFFGPFCVSHKSKLNLYMYSFLQQFSILLAPKNSYHVGRCSLPGGLTSILSTKWFF